MMTETVPIEPDCPALIPHMTELVVIQDVVLHEVPATCPVSEISAAPKFKPLIVIEVCPVVGPFGLINCVITGDVYEKTDSLVPTMLLTVREM